MDALFWLSLAGLFYVYAGYPLLAAALVRLRGARPWRRDDATPAVSLVISAYNEADVIRAKLENAVALDYPAGRLEIVVISDASSDGTDDIVLDFGPRVRLARLAERSGKTRGLNAIVPTLSGDIVVFSDANAMYRSDAIRKLVRNFADPAVGCVTGEARYVPDGRTAADTGERAYWSYEIRLKQLESALGSMVGGDGAIYAIRRDLWRPLPPAAINDFLNPLQIVAAGRRAVYEPEAICTEETAGSLRLECRRRVRIVSRSWRAVFQAPGVLNPLQVGLFTWSLVSHKLLRWFTGLFAAGAAIGAAATGGPLVVRLADGPLLIGATGAATSAVLVVPSLRRAFTVPIYFAAVSMASLAGVLMGMSGRVSGVWSPARQASSSTPADAPAAARRRGGMAGLRRAAAPAAKSWLFRSGVCRALHTVRPLRGIAVLRYHAVCGPEGYGYADPHLCISPEGFERHVAYLADRYTVLELPAAVRALREGRPLPPNAVALTFDDGYADNLAAARILRRYDATGTFYITAGCLDGEQPFWPAELRILVNNVRTPSIDLSVAGRPLSLASGTDAERRLAIGRLTRLFKSVTIPVRDDLRRQLRTIAGNPPLPTIMLSWAELAEMQKLGMTIGAHTLTHPNLPSAGLDGATAEIVGSKRRLQHELGTPVTMFSYPNGGAERYYSPELEEAVREAGFLAAATSQNGFAGYRSDLYALERVQVAERLEDLVFALEVERFVCRPDGRSRAGA